MRSARLAVKQKSEVLNGYYAKADKAHGSSTVQAVASSAGMLEIIESDLTKRITEMVAAK